MFCERLSVRKSLIFLQIKLAVTLGFLAEYDMIVMNLFVRLVDLNGATTKDQLPISPHTSQLPSSNFRLPVCPRSSMTFSQLPHIFHRPIINLPRPTDKVMQQRKEHNSPIDQTGPVHLRNRRVDDAWEEAKHKGNPEESQAPDIQEDADWLREGEGCWKQGQVAEAAPED